MPFFTADVPIVPITLPLSGASILLKRDDLRHPFISGNKPGKLMVYIRNFYRGKQNGIISFGGAFSNHLVALAALCSEYGIPAIFIVRGEELNAESNEILRFCTRCGVRIFFARRKEYDQRDYESLAAKFVTNAAEYLIIPEGGCGEPGVEGIAELNSSFPEPVTNIFIGAGFGTTAAGIARAHPAKTIHAICAAGDSNFILQNNASYKLANIRWYDEYSRGGFGKMDAYALSYLIRFYKSNGILLDPVYTVKMMLAIEEKMLQQDLAAASVMAIHSGGLSGLISQKCVELLSKDADYDVIKIALKKLTLRCREYCL